MRLGLIKFHAAPNRIWFITLQYWTDSSCYSNNRPTIPNDQKFPGAEILLELLLKAISARGILAPFS